MQGGVVEDGKAPCTDGVSWGGSYLRRSCSSTDGAPAIDWGCVDEIGTRDCLRRIRERREVKWCEELEWGKPPFIGLRRLAR